MFTQYHDRLIRVQEVLQAPFLLAIRLYWGWQFFQTGKGKLANIGPIVEFFQSLHIPFPSFNAHLVGMTEFLGGLFLILGLGSRIVTLPLTVLMIVAYLTADLEAVKVIFSDPDTFVKATPFPFLFTVLVVMLFGGGVFSIDKLIGKFFSKKSCHCV